MSFTQKAWVDVPEGQTPPSGTPALDADNMNRIEGGIVDSIKKDIGFISFYCNSTPPDGWLVCDGSAISREIYIDLYNCIGDKFGSGDGYTTFNLPDLRGEFIRGWSGSSSVDANRDFGSKQESTRFRMDSVVEYVSGGEESVTKYSYRSTAGGNGGDATFISIRPRNIALLPCIFTGVFND